MAHLYSFSLFVLCILYCSSYSIFIDMFFNLRGVLFIYVTNCGFINRSCGEGRKCIRTKVVDIVCPGCLLRFSVCSCSTFCVLESDRRDTHTTRPWWRENDQAYLSVLVPIDITNLDCPCQLSICLNAIPICSPWFSHKWLPVEECGANFFLWFEEMRFP